MLTTDLIEKIANAIPKIGDTSNNVKAEKTIRVMSNPLVTIVNDFRIYNMDSRTFFIKISKWAHAKQERSSNLEILSETDDQIRILNYVHSATSPGAIRYTWESMAIYNVIFDFDEKRMKITARVEPNTTPWILRCREWVAQCIQDSRILNDNSRVGEFYDSAELQDYMFQRWHGALLFIVAIHVFFTVIGLFQSLESVINANLGALFLDGFLLLMTFIGNYQYRDYV